MLWRRLFGSPLPPARWSLGRLGTSINVVSVLFLAQYIPISYFPVFKNVTAQTMNWGIAMFGGATLLAVTYYFANGRCEYEGPVVHIRKELEPGLAA